MCEKMFSIKQGIQATVLVSVYLSGLYAQPALDEGASFNSNLPNPDLVRTDNSYIREILNRMAGKGDQHLKDNNISATQILVIAVLSASEVDAKQQDISDGMIEILPNEFIDKLPTYFYRKKVKVHGEILAIHFKKTINELLNKLDKKRNSNDARPPYVFIFSHQIPCAGLTNVHYSCAEELANLGRVNRNRYKIIVGYRYVWKDCDTDFAFQLLQEGGIHILMNISSGQVLDRRLTIEPEIYQEKLTECLTNLTRIPEDSAACFINTFTKNCSSGKDLHGYMTQLTKAILHECVEKYVKGQPLELYVRYCSLGTLYRTIRLMLGQPTSKCEASWTSTPDDLNWDELYKDDGYTDAQEFSSFSVSSDDLKILHKKCAADKKHVDSSAKNKYQAEMLSDLLTDINKEAPALKQAENAEKEKRSRERERLKKNSEHANIREKHT